MEETFIRSRFRAVALRMGAPDASKIGQHEIVSNDVLEALDRASHDEELFVRHLAGVPVEEAVQRFMSIRHELMMEGLCTMDEQTFTRLFLPKLGS